MTRTCLRCRVSLRRVHLDLARTAEGSRLPRQQVHPTPRRRSRRAVAAHAVIGGDLGTAIHHQEDRSGTDRPHSNLEARREVNGHRSVTRREAVHRLPVMTIRKHTLAETQGQAHLDNQSCLWQRMSLRMKDLLELRSRTAKAPSTTATSTTTSRTSKMPRTVPTRVSSSCRPRTCRRSMPTSRLAARSRRTLPSRCRSQTPRQTALRRHRRVAGYRLPRCWRLSSPEQ